MIEKNSIEYIVFGLNFSATIILMVVTNWLRNLKKEFEKYQLIAVCNERHKAK